METFDTFDLYFSGLVTMSLHPGYLKYETDRPTTKQCAELALQMLEEKQCLFTSQEPPL